MDIDNSIISLSLIVVSYCAVFFCMYTFMGCTKFELGLKRCFREFHNHHMPGPYILLVNIICATTWRLFGVFLIGYRHDMVARPYHHEDRTTSSHHLVTDRIISHMMHRGSSHTCMHPQLVGQHTGGWVGPREYASKGEARLDGEVEGI